jgi:CBS domain-containing protein
VLLAGIDFRDHDVVQHERMDMAGWASRSPRVKWQLRGATMSARQRARDLMPKSIVQCSEREDLADELRVMEQKKIRRLSVIRVDGRYVEPSGVSRAASGTLTGEVLAAVPAHHA